MSQSVSSRFSLRTVSSLQMRESKSNNVNIHLAAIVRFAVLNGNELGEYASI